MVKKLRCDRCGLEITEKEDIYLAYDGMEAWHAAARARGIEPRGVLPCKNYMRCGGEIVEVKEHNGLLKKLSGRKENTKGEGQD